MNNVIINMSTDKNIIRIGEKETPESITAYILGSKQNIDSYINKREFRKAFGLLIAVLERLDATEKTEFINYYSKNMEEMGFFDNVFPSR